MRQLSEIIFNQTPLVLPPHAVVQEACSRMRQRHVGSVLVTGEQGQLLGIFTGRDAVSRVVAESRDATLTQLETVMTKDPVTLQADKKAIDALRLMRECGFRHLPVISREHVVGVVSWGDFNGLEVDRLDDERSLWEHIR